MRKNGENSRRTRRSPKLEIDGQKLLTRGLRDISEPKHDRSSAPTDAGTPGARAAGRGPRVLGLEHQEPGRCVFDRRWAEMLGYDLGELAPHVDTWIRSHSPGGLGRA